MPKANEPRTPSSRRDQTVFIRVLFGKQSIKDIPARPVSQQVAPQWVNGNATRGSRADEGVRPTLTRLRVRHSQFAEHRRCPLSWVYAMEQPNLNRRDLLAGLAFGALPSDTPPA